MASLAPMTVVPCKPIVTTSRSCRTPRDPDYMLEATFERMVPGEGDMSPADYLAAIPAGVTVSIEVPLKPQAGAGIAPADLLPAVMMATRDLLAEFSVRAAVAQ